MEQMRADNEAKRRKQESAARVMSERAIANDKAFFAGVNATIREMEHALSNQPCTVTLRMSSIGNGASGS